VAPPSAADFAEPDEAVGSGSASAAVEAPPPSAGSAAPPPAAPAIAIDRKDELAPEITKLTPTAAEKAAPSDKRVAAAIPAPSAAAATKAPAKQAVVVPPNAVKRTSGQVPALKAVLRPGTQIPKSLAAKICINESGGVTSVQVLKATGEIAQAFASSIRQWRYTPYKQGGVATPACFVNSFQLGQ
jgi:hypothetical protein